MFGTAMNLSSAASLVSKRSSAQYIPLVSIHARSHTGATRSSTRAQTPLSAGSCVTQTSVVALRDAIAGGTVGPSEQEAAAFLAGYTVCTTTLLYTHDTYTQAAQETLSPPSDTAHSAPDSLARSALKGVTWRVFSTGLTMTVALAIFGKEQAADVLKFGLAEVVIKFFLYFLHERLWAMRPLVSTSR